MTDQEAAEYQAWLATVPAHPGEDILDDVERQLIGLEPFEFGSAGFESLGDAEKYARRLGEL